MRHLWIAMLLACSHPAAPVSHEPGETGAVTEAEFKAMHAAPTTNAAQLHGQEFQLAGTKAYLSLPPGPGPHPGIVLIHEWWGLNGNIEHWADRLASAGWAALAVDLYSGTVATTPDQAMATMKTVDKAKAAQTISAALDYLKTDPRIAAPKRAVIGWCYGGGWALETAVAHPELDGMIMYYGMLDQDPAKLAGIKARVVAIFGDRDKSIPPADVDQFEAALKEADVKADVYRYDADHAFANPSNPHYDEASAGNAWKHVLAFLEDLRK
jgi:carboxymethylenebutenolidase